MRTIKYRGKTKDGEWIYGYYLPSIYEDVDIITVLEDFNLNQKNYAVLKDTVGQFTGLFDKNGKEIYEGDIVKFTKWNGELATGLVKWADCNPCMCIEFKTEYKQKDWEFDFIKCGTMKIEVIGNIHDNPELIKD